MGIEDEIRKRRLKFVHDVAPLEIIDNEEDEDFMSNADVVNMKQIDLVIHVISHSIIFQYWSLESLNSSSSSSCPHQHHRDHHHLDEDEEMIMISCQPTKAISGKHLIDRGVFASYEEDHHHHQRKDDDDDDYIMSLLRDLDILYETEWIPTHEDLEEVKRCVTQRICEAKPAVLMAKPKRVRIRVDLSTIMKTYYANSVTATSAAVQAQLYNLKEVDDTALYHPHAPSPESQSLYHEIKPAAFRSSIEALETKIFEKEDASSSSCPICLNEFRVGVDSIKKMSCSHVFHSTCLTEWFWEQNTCPLCRYELPTFRTSFPHLLPFP